MQPNPTVANLLRAEEIFCKVHACLMSSLEQWLENNLRKNACWTKNLGSEERRPGNPPRPVKVVYLLVYGVTMQMCAAGLRARLYNELNWSAFIIIIIIIISISSCFDVAQRLRKHHGKKNNP